MSLELASNSQNLTNDLSINTGNDVSTNSDSDVTIPLKFTVIR